MLRHRTLTAVIALFLVVLAGSGFAAAPAAALAVQAQQSDLDYLVGRLCHHPELKQPGRRKAFLAYASRIRAEADKPLPYWKLLELEDRLVRWLDDPHTMFFAWTGSGPMRVLPLTFYWASDGLVALRIPTTPASIRTGDKVLAISGIPTVKIERMLHRFFAANTYFIRNDAAYRLAFSPLLHWLGAVKAGDVVSLRLQRSDGAAYVANLQLVPMTSAGVEIPAAGSMVTNMHVALSDMIREDLMPKEHLSHRGPTWAWGVTPRYGFFLLTSCDDTASYEQAVNAFFEAVAKEQSPAIALDLQENSGGDSAVVLSCGTCRPGT